MGSPLHRGPGLGDGQANPAQRIRRNTKRGPAEAGPGRVRRRQRDLYRPQQNDRGSMAGYLEQGLSRRRKTLYGVKLLPAYQESYQARYGDYQAGGAKRPHHPELLQWPRSRAGRQAGLVSENREEHPRRAPQGSPASREAGLSPIQSRRRLRASQDGAEGNQASGR